MTDDRTDEKPPLPGPTGQAIQPMLVKVWSVGASLQAEIPDEFFGELSDWLARHKIQRSSKQL